MPLRRFSRSIRLAAPAEFVFDWHCRPGAFERLRPPWEYIEVLDAGNGVADGSRVTIAVKIGPIIRRWVAEHCDVMPGRQFTDIQIAGPFAAWRHTHRVQPEGEAACVLFDEIEYALPLGNFGESLGGPYVERQLDRLFRYRHAVTASDIAWCWAYREEQQMNIVVSGSTGLVGSALIPVLTTGGHNVSRLVRSRSNDRSKQQISWDPNANFVDAAGLEGVDAVIHLAGDPIASSRWNEAKKARIRDSRVRGTRLLCETLGHLQNPPKTLICASATGFYGSRGDEVLAESSSNGTGFLAEVCRDWEAAAEPARKRGIRVVHLRTGVVLTPAGGALAKMLLPFKMGAGGIIGDGRQYMSCIAIDDLVAAIVYLLVTPTIAGPVNAVCPHPVTNAEFTQTLGKVLGRPTVFPMPAFAARLAFGEMAQELLLASQRVIPTRLSESGFRFCCPDIESALRHVLGKPS